MQYLLFAALLAAASPPAQAADVGVSIGVNEPGIYGRIDIGNLPPPRVIYQKPIVIWPPPVARAPPPPPIYLRVPPSHTKQWRKHCHEYNACGQRVYFVREDWYNDVYLPHSRGHGDRRDGRRDEGRGAGPDHGNRDKGQGRGRD